MQQLILMVGVNGSDKSKFAEEIKKDSPNYTIVSLEQLNNNQNIFINEIKQALREGKDVIADGNNLTLKARRGLLEAIKNIDCQKTAYICAKFLDECFRTDQKSANPLTEELFNKQCKSFQIPFKEEGFDDIQIKATPSEYEYSAFSKTLKELMSDFDQKSPYHNQTLGKHCETTTNVFVSNKKYNKEHLKYFSELHDSGKLNTQSINEEGKASYYSHENMGSLFLLSNYNSIKKETNFSDEEILEGLFLVNYHMLPSNWQDDKNIEKAKQQFGEDKFEMLKYFNECDKVREKELEHEEIR